MTYKEALEILTKTDRVGVNLIFANDEETTKYNQDSIEAFNLAIKALEEVEEWHKLKLICANEGIVVYKVRGEKE